MPLISSRPLKTLPTKHFFLGNRVNSQLLCVPLQPMNRKDIKLFGEIQTRLQGYCGKVLATLVKDYPEVDISESARVIGIDVLDDYLQMTYYAYPINRSIFIPIQYVEAEDVDGFCRVYAEKIRRDGKLMREDEFIEKTYNDLWMRFYDLFDIRMTDPEPDLDRARNKLHDLVETATYLLLMTKRKNKDPKNAQVLTEKDLPSLNAVFAMFLDWSRKDKFWSKREKSENEIAYKTKAELIALQEDIIKRIKENEYHTKEELQYAEDALEAIKNMKLP